MAVNIPGAIAVVVFYLLILVSGIIAGRKTNKKNQTKESVLVADRNLGKWLSTFTITATMVGGAFINGCAEAAAAYGLLYSQAIIGYSISFLPAGLLYAPKMRREEYVTMFDPFQLKYGRKVGALLFIPQFFGDLFWSSAVLWSLGATISIILDIDATLSIIVSAVVAIFYTFFGGLYAVAYTDVFQLIIIGVGLCVAFPFCLTHDAVDLSQASEKLWGTIPSNMIGSYIDLWLMCMGGGIPWQALYQRVLACKTAEIAKWSTLMSIIGTVFLATPAVLIGIAGGNADWNQTVYDGEIPLPAEKMPYILPLSLNYLTPTAVGIVGIGAMAAAVMSSADSCFLSSSTIIAKNIFQELFRPEATAREITWVLRISIVVVGTLATVIAISVDTIFGLFVLCGDLMYVVLLPQLTFVLWVESVNAYGCLSGFIVSFLLRILCGESVIGLPAVLKFPGYDEEYGMQHFPVRTFAMLIGTFFLVTVSLLTNYLFLNDKISAKYDFLKCTVKRTIHIRNSKKESQPSQRNSDVTKPIFIENDNIEDDQL